MPVGPMTENAFKLIHNLISDHIDQLLGLYHEEWWTKSRKIDDVKEMLKNTTYIFAVTDMAEKELYGFSRVLSDQVYFALIFDVIVKKEHRDKGIGTFILSAIKSHPRISQIEYLELCCRKDLMPFYQKNGFNPGDGRMNIIKPKS
jgi:predicted GNAT family N-acyltransferase